jgi:hypothetical protein
MRRLRSIDLRREDGIAIALAVILMAFMLTMGLAAASYVDEQSTLTAKQRQRETAFNVAEAALNAQVTQISHHWVGINGYDSSTGTTNPSVGFMPCPGGAFCPTASELTTLVPGADTKVAITWQTNVYDNDSTRGLGSYFADSLVGATPPCGCDQNLDGKVWVRAEATVRGHKRVIVSLVQEQTQAESAPHAAIIAGALTIENNGLHSVPIIDSNGGIVAVRCSVPPPPENSTTPCLGQPLGVSPTQTTADWDNLLNNQISGFSNGSGAQQNYPGPPVFSADQLNRFLNTARAEGTYFTSCPSTLAGQVVVIDTVGNCTYTGTDVWNSETQPGFLILLNSQSSLTLGGTTVFYGIIYHANQGTPQSSAPLIITQGNTLIQGGVIIDGPGRMDAGESGLNIKFDDHGYDSVKSLADAGIIQNSWREIQPGA